MQGKRFIFFYGVSTARSLLFVRVASCQSPTCAVLQSCCLKVSLCPSFPSNSAKHLKEGGDGVHAIEKVQGNGKIQNGGPRREAVNVLLQPVVILRSAAERREEPQLKDRNARFHSE